MRAALLLIAACLAFQPALLGIREPVRAKSAMVLAPAPADQSGAWAAPWDTEGVTCRVLAP